MIDSNRNFMEREIMERCKRFGISNYIINENLSIDVDGDVNFNKSSITSLPIRFGVVTGDFICSYNVLTTLIWCPIKVGGDFRCAFCRITSLLGSPKWVGGDYLVHQNKLTSLQHFPEFVGGDISLTRNEITDFNGLCKNINGNTTVWCYGNKLHKNKYIELFELGYDISQICGDFNKFNIDDINSNFDNTLHILQRQWIIDNIIK